MAELPRTRAVFSPPLPRRFFLFFISDSVALAGTIATLPLPSFAHLFLSLFFLVLHAVLRL